MSSTIVWFVGLLTVGLLVLDRDLDGMRALIDREPGEGAPAASAGPTFVQQEQQRQEQARPEEIERLTSESRPAPTPVGADRSAIEPGAGIEDVCLEGARDACTRWAMDGFHAALERTDRGEALTRITLWGDSVTAEGFIAKGMRRELTRAHGDGGAGFVYMTAPSNWYHNDVIRPSNVGRWVINSIIHNGVPDKLYGYGGVSFTGTEGESVTFRTAVEGPGERVARFELYYLASPRGGTLEIRVDGEVATTVDTRAERTGSGFAAITMEDGPHKIDVMVTDGTVRAFGATLERATGVVVDNLGVVSNTAKNLAGIRDAHWREQIAHRDADLLMVLLGANESNWVNDKVEMKDLRADWDQLLGRLRQANPEASCLVVGTLDAGKWVDGKYISRKSIPRMIAVERAAAQAAGCAFWDARAYMARTGGQGGKDPARLWKKRGLMAADHEHLTAKGGEVLGSGIVAALEAGYASHQRR